MTRRGIGRRGGPADRGTATRLTVSCADERVCFVHAGSRPPRRLVDIAGWLGPARPDEAVVLVGTPLGGEGVEGLCERLAPALQEFKDQEVELLRLVMSAGADEAESRLSTARLICERWCLDVLATAGPAVVVPDGTLFSPDLPDAPGGWWHFSVGEIPRFVGSRLPIPAWEPALRRMDQGAVPGHVVEPVPAGLMIRPVGTVAAAVHTLPYAVPPDPDRPHLLVDTPSVPAAGLAAVIAALPGRVRKDVRLLSLDGSSLIETGQAVADLLGTDVHVANGLPVVVDDGGAGEASTELYMVDAEGTPAWRPFAETLTCAPAADSRGARARVTTWRAPAPLLQGTEHGALPFDQTWKVAVTPAGLWAGPRSSEPPPVAATRTAGADTVAIELGAPHRALDAALWPSLDRLFDELEPEVRERAVVHVHGVLGSKGMENLRRLTVRHNFSLMPQTKDSAAGDTKSASSAAESFPSPSRTLALGAAPEETPEADGTDQTREADETKPTPELPTQTATAEQDPTPAPKASPAQPGARTRSEEQVLPQAPGHPSPVIRTSRKPPGTPSAPMTSTPAVSTLVGPTLGPAPAPPPRGQDSLAEPARQGTGSSRHGDTSGVRGCVEESDHARLRAYLGPFWEQHRRAVSQMVERLFTRIPREQSEDTIAELVAVHVYMTAVDDAQLRSALAEGDHQSRTLLRCLQSGMRRLPTYRGAVLSTAEELVSRVAPDAVGDEWEGTVPVRAVSVGDTYPAPPTDHVLIWSVTGRRTGTSAVGGGQEILFGRESTFRVVGVVPHGPAVVGLLQEMPQQVHISSPQLEPALLNRLRMVLDLPAAEPGRDADPPVPRPGPAPFPGQGA